MSIIEYIIGGILLALGIVLIVLIGMQQGKRHGLGNSIAGQGASESYLAKNNIGGKEKSRQKITLIVAIIFVVLTLVLYIYGSVETTSDNTSSTASTTSTTSTTSKTETSIEASKTESSVAETSSEASAEESK